MTVAALVVGVAIGVITTMLVLRRGPMDVVDLGSATDAEPPSPAAMPETDTALGPLLEAAVEHSDRSVIIVDALGQVQFRNASARQLSGTHVGVLLDSEVDDISEAARTDGVVERRVDLHGPPKATLQLVARDVGDGAVVVLIDDVSERERIAQMRTDFVANISHELKTPVGAIAVLADALVDETDPAVVARVAGRIADESERAVTTIDDLLELSRIESAPATDEVIDVHDIVEAALARGRTVETDKRVQLSAFDAAEPIWIRGDGRQITSAVGNLVENAVKYSDVDGVVQVRTRRHGGWIEIMVADHGVGIPTRDLARVFERFYRVDRARSRSTGGTGLGLSIARNVATNHGGDVQVSSTEGEGSTFVFRLPASIETGPPSETVAAGGDSSMSEGL